MTIDQHVIQALAKQLLSTGTVITTTPEGRKLFLVSQEVLGHPDRLMIGGILAALEGGGCFYWDGLATINPFKLISAGFDYDTAATLDGVLRMIGDHMNNPR